MSQKRIYKKYEALGFVEALMAILIAGITSILLMGIAVDTIKMVVKNEIADSMTQVAIEAGARVKSIAEKNNNSTEKLFPDIASHINSCFQSVGSANDPQFQSENGDFVTVCNYDSGGRDNCKSSVSANASDLFEVFCITPESNSTSGLVVGKIVVGKTKCISSEDCDVADYEYYVLTKTLQK